VISPPQNLAKISRIYTRKEEEEEKKKVLCYEINQKMSKKKSAQKVSLEKPPQGQASV
jgi:hypothetical protein